MQTQPFQNQDDFDYFSTLNECMPFLDQAITGDFSMDSSSTDQHLMASFLRKCLTELKECKATLAMQEDTIQTATDALLNLREENTQLADTNQSLTNQITNLTQHLEEAETVAVSLRSEINNLRQENRILADACNNVDTTSKVDTSNILSEQFEQGVIKEGETETDNEKAYDCVNDQSLIINTLIQKNDLIRSLTQNVEELYGIKEKYDQLLKENEAQKSLKEYNKQLQDELVATKEANMNLLQKSPDTPCRKLPAKSLEVLDNAQPNQLESENVWGFLNIKDEDGQNKNCLAPKSMIWASPSKENVDIKKQNLLAETILFNSSKSPLLPPLQKKNSDKKPIPANHPPRNMAVVNFGGLLKATPRITSETLTEALLKEEPESTDQYKRQIKNNQDFSLSLYSAREGQSSRKEKLNISARKHETSFELNTSKNSEDLCFDEMLSWEEGDFPRLNTSNLTCSSPYIGPQSEGKWVTKSDIDTKEVLAMPAKEQSLRFNLKEINPVDILKQIEPDVAVEKESQKTGNYDQEKKILEEGSILPNKISVEKIESNEVCHDKPQSTSFKDAGTERFKESMTQTDNVGTLTLNDKNNVNTKYITVGTLQNRWKSYFSAMSVLFCLLFIFLTFRAENCLHTEL